jgi:hypothetical protein
LASSGTASLDIPGDIGPKINTIMAKLEPLSALSQIQPNSQSNANHQPKNGYINRQGRPILHPARPPASCLLFVRAQRAAPLPALPKTPLY